MNARQVAIVVAALVAAAGVVWLRDAPPSAPLAANGLPREEPTRPAAVPAPAEDASAQKDALWADPAAAREGAAPLSTGESPELRSNDLDQAISDLTVAVEAGPIAGLNPNGVLDSALLLLERAAPDPRFPRAVGESGTQYALRGLPSGFEGAFEVRGESPNGGRSFDLFLDWRLRDPIWLDGLPRKLAGVSLSLTFRGAESWEPERYFLAVPLDVDGRSAERHGLDWEGTDHLVGVGYWMASGREPEAKRIYSRGREAGKQPNPCLQPLGALPPSDNGHYDAQEMAFKIPSTDTPVRLTD